jgi:heme A synthase
VAAHLGLAKLLQALTIYIRRASKPEVIGAEPPRESSRINSLSLAAPVLILCTIVAGGYMAGTQKYGRPDYQLGDGAHHACGKQFPTCNDGFLPFGQSRLVDIHLTHRVFMYLATIVVLWLAVSVIRARPGRNLVRAAWAAVALLVAQLLVGALNVWLDEYEALIVLHLTVATLIWGVLVALRLELMPVPEPSGQTARRREPEAVAA